MRVHYLDTGSREPAHALGTWLGQVLLASTPVTALRVQSGFFGSDTLGYFEETLRALEEVNAHTRILVGSNDGQTARAALARLLALAGPNRSELRLGVVSFAEGYFHPKVFHFERADGSSTAYVGSANLTHSGAASLHVEAGIVLDTKDGDSPAVLDSIADVIDKWFTASRLGLYEIASEADLDALVAHEVIGVKPPHRPKRTMTTSGGSGKGKQHGHSLKHLVAMPPVHATGGTTNEGAEPPADGDGDEGPPSERGKAVAHWSKQIRSSDAQRRATGHQSGALALTQGDYRHQIDQTTYFRHEMFGGEAWDVEQAPRRKPVEAAYVPMRVSIDGTDHGQLEFRISHAPHRESSTNSPTTYIHLEPLQAVFAQTNMEGKQVEIERFADGAYALTIS